MAKKPVVSLSLSKEVRERLMELPKGWRSSLTQKVLEEFFKEVDRNDVLLTLFLMNKAKLKIVPTADEEELPSKEESRAPIQPTQESREQEKKAPQERATRKSPLDDLLPDDEF